MKTRRLDPRWRLLGRPIPTVLTAAEALAPPPKPKDMTFRQVAIAARNYRRRPSIADQYADGTTLPRTRGRHV